MAQKPETSSDALPRTGLARSVFFGVLLSGLGLVAIELLTGQVEPAVQRLIREAVPDSPERGATGPVARFKLFQHAVFLNLAGDTRRIPS